MTTDELTPTPAPAPEPVPAQPANAGAMLVRGREEAGLSIEGIAAQLKLAPRQVRALEESDFAALPGRTFVRGFVRNYARLVHLDPAVVLAALPGDGADPGLTRPALAGQGRAMGEIPAEHAARRTWTRWAIPLALIAVVAVAVAYERLRPQHVTGSDAGALATPADSAAPRTAVEPSAGATALPNPAAATAVETPPASDSTTVSGSEPAAAPDSGAPATTRTAPASVAAAAPDAAGATAPMLEVAFRGVSWIEVKDAKGNSVLNMTGAPGVQRSLRATPPLELVVGNATLVEVTFRGARVDLAPYTRQNIARLTLR